MSKLTTTLLPCPFCGKTAVTRQFRYQDSEFMQHGTIGCDSCGIHMKWSDIRTDKRHDTDHEEKAVQAWNKRHNPGSQPPESELPFIA